MQPTQLSPQSVDWQAQNGVRDDGAPVPNAFPTNDPEAAAANALTDPAAFADTSEAATPEANAFASPTPDASDTPEASDPEADADASTDPDADSSPKPKSAPGWIKRRIEEGVRKEAVALEKRLRAEYEQQLRPLREMALAHQADELVRQGEFRSRERAAEYLRLKAEAGLSTSSVQTRAQELYIQAKTIRDVAGQDVLAVYNANESIKRKVLSGEWDFLDVFTNLSGAKAAQSGGAAAGAQSPAAPSPVRTANGASLGKVNIGRMTKSELDRMNELLSRGGVVDLRG